MKKIKIQITHWVTGSVLFEYESENNTIKKTLEEAVLSGVDLSGADLSGADLRRASLWRADLRGVDLSGADLSGADLRRASLWRADLRGVDLSGADLWRADLSGAGLRGADLWRAKNIEGDLTDFWWHVHHAILVEQLIEPIRARINYIKKEKSKNEIDIRLKLLKPVLGKIPNTEKGWERLHKKECGCKYWNGEELDFSL